MGNIRQHLTLNRDSKIALVAVFAYIFEVYGALLLRYYDLINDMEWAKIHFVGVQIVFLILTYLIKKSINQIVYSVLIGLFTARLISHIFFDSFESWFEMPLIIATSILIYSITRYVSRNN